MFYCLDLSPPPTTFTAPCPGTFSSDALRTLKLSSSGKNHLFPYSPHHPGGVTPLSLASVHNPGGQGGVGSTSELLGDM